MPPAPLRTGHNEPRAAFGVHARMVEQLADRVLIAATIVVV
jgi:hypothetical protein